MEPFLADLINNPKVPKIIRYLLVSAASLFLIVVFILATIKSPFIFGKIFCALVAIVVFIMYIYLLKRIYTSKNEAE